VESRVPSRREVLVQVDDSQLTSHLTEESGVQTRILMSPETPKVGTKTTNDKSIVSTFGRNTPCGDTLTTSVKDEAQVVYSKHFEASEPLSKTI
jgi:hypothetical protein